MVSPNKHGINKVNLKLPKDGWRLIVLFRNLRPVIKRQIENISSGIILFDIVSRI